MDFQLGGILPDSLSGPVLAMLLVLFVFGVAKAAMMPFHRWLPAAMVAPTPVSALLHAVAVVKAGVFSLIKILVFIVGIERLQSIPMADYLLTLPALASCSPRWWPCVKTISRRGWLTQR